MRPTLAERFWSKVDRSGGPDACWIWIGSKINSGYGQIRLFGKNGPDMLAHRLSWQLRNGPIAEGLQCCHRCDIRACVNPAHLFLGSQADNLADMSAKGRSTRGRTRISMEEVEEIHSSSEPQRAIARRTGVSQSTVSRIKNMSDWTPAK